MLWVSHFEIKLGVKSMKYNLSKVFDIVQKQAQAMMPSHGQITEDTKLRHDLTMDTLDALELEYNIEKIFAEVLDHRELAILGQGAMVNFPVYKAITVGEYAEKILEVLEESPAPVPL